MGTEVDEPVQDRVDDFRFEPPPPLVLLRRLLRRRSRWLLLLEACPMLFLLSFLLDRLLCLSKCRSSWLMGCGAGWVADAVLVALVLAVVVLQLAGVGVSSKTEAKSSSPQLLCESWQLLSRLSWRRLCRVWLPSRLELDLLWWFLDPVMSVSMVSMLISPQDMLSQSSIRVERVRALVLFFSKAVRSMPKVTGSGAEALRE